jgi:glycosyltransferase involved in cell wall biosynthesis
LNVCFVSPEYFPISGGTGAYVYYLSRELQKLGHNVHVVARATADSTDTVDGVSVNYLKGVGSPLTRYWRYARSTVKKLEELDKKVGFDVIHANLPLVPSFAIRRGSAKALISTVHSTWRGEADAIKGGKRGRLNPNEKLMLRFNSLLRSYEKDLMKRSDALIAVSMYTRKELIELYDIAEEKIHVIYNGVDVQKFKPDGDRDALRRELAVDGEQKVILYVGRLYHRKGLATLLQSMSKVVKRFEDVKLIISGKGFRKNEENLRGLTERLDIEDYVMFLGYFPDEKLPDLYAASDIFVLPAWYENFPFAILEAQSTGLPVISTKVGGIPEFLTKENGLLVEPSDPEQLAQRIIDLLQNPELARELGRCGRRLIEERFSWPLIADEVVDLYREISAAG